MNRDEQIRELKQWIADLKARLPRHSVPPAMVMELEELEEELARAQEARWGKQRPEGVEL